MKNMKGTQLIPLCKLGDTCHKDYEARNSMVIEYLFLSAKKNEMFVFHLQGFEVLGTSYHDYVDLNYYPTC